MERAVVNVLIVEDEPLVAMDLQKKLRQAGYNAPVVAGSAEEVFSSMKTFSPDLILMDVRIRGNCDGIEIAEAIRQFSDIPIIFVTGQGDKATVERARRTLASGYFVKPVSFASLCASIEMALFRVQTGSRQNL